MVLKTDYKDDELDLSKNVNRKYNQIINDDGTVSFEDVTEYTTEGDTFGASAINQTNKEVNALNESLTAQDGEPFRYAKVDGKRGIMVNEEGADTFYPFKSGFEIVEVKYGTWGASQGLTIPVSKRPNGFMVTTTTPNRTSYAPPCYIWNAKTNKVEYWYNGAKNTEYDAIITDTSITLSFASSSAANLYQAFIW